MTSNISQFKNKQQQALEKLAEEIINLDKDDTLIVIKFKGNELLPDFRHYNSNLPLTVGYIDIVKNYLNNYVEAAQQGELEEVDDYE